MTILCAIPVCERDAWLVLKNLAWLRSLKQNPRGLHCLITCEKGFNEILIVEEAKQVFERVSVYKYEPFAGNPSWPEPQNYAWQKTARQIAAEKLGPWLWWEADATPLTPDWLNRLAGEYSKGSKPFMGAWVNELPDIHYMAGVGVYPEQVVLHTKQALYCTRVPFDMVAWKEMQQSHDLCHVTSLIQHIRTINPPLFKNIEKLRATLTPDAVLFHPCKDGRVIDLLSNELGVVTTETSAPADFAPLPLRCRLDDYTGYGQVSTELVLNLIKLEEKLEFRLSLHPEAVDYRYGPIPPEIAARLTNQPNHHSWEAILYTLVVSGTRLHDRKRSVFWTMWESTRIPEVSLELLNRCEAVMTPNQWFASCLSAQGLKVPVHIVPLGIEIDKWTPLPMPSAGKNEVFTIGTAGRLNMGGIRKGVGVVIEAFKQAFTNGEKVRLRVKCEEDAEIARVDDKRIELIRDHLSHEDFRKWYGSLHVYASGSACEGWGRHQQEAMACGRPVIGVNFGGITEFWNPTNGYAVDYEMIEGEGPYAGNGRYAQPDVESMAVQMKKAWRDRDTLIEKGKLSQIAAKRFTSERMAIRFVQVLRRLELI